MRAFFSQVFQSTKEISRKIVELQRTLVVVRIAIAARVPGGGLEAMARKEPELLQPVITVAADAVQEEHERAAPLHRDGDARRAGNEEHFRRHSAFAPEIFPA